MYNVTQFYWCTVSYVVDLSQHEINFQNVVLLYFNVSVRISNDFI